MSSYPPDTPGESKEGNSGGSNQGGALRARVPDHVAGGTFSTGAIVMTGQSEFIIDFLQTIGRPHRVAKRVIVPHGVMPQFIDALNTNLNLYTSRFGPVPAPASSPQTTDVSGNPSPAAKDSEQALPDEGSAGSGPGDAAGSGAPGVTSGSSPAEAAMSSEVVTSSGNISSSPPPRRPSPQEIYDDLKLPDEELSGVYANGVMIGHGASEFGLDFLTSFFPQSAVSARVFLASGQVPRLLESLRGAMEQFQNRRRPPSEGGQSDGDFG